HSHAFDIALLSGDCPPRSGEAHCDNAFFFLHSWNLSACYFEPAFAVAKIGGEFEDGKIKLSIKSQPTFFWVTEHDTRLIFIERQCKHRLWISVELCLVFLPNMVTGHQKPLLPRVDQR